MKECGGFGFCITSIVHLPGKRKFALILWRIKSSIDENNGYIDDAKAFEVIWEQKSLKK